MKQDNVFSEDYRPVEGEPFMNDRQLEYFRRKLVTWKNDLMSDSKETIEGLQDNTRNIPDIADRASEETDRALELRTRDRQRKVVSKLDAALRRIDEGEYGYCEIRDTQRQFRMGDTLEGSLHLGKTNFIHIKVP